MDTSARGPQTIWTAEIGDGPVVATAVHNGHRVRDEVAELLELTPEERLREEDPFTARWTRVAPVRVVALRSRFEVDLNRPRDEAVYQKPDAAWGLSVWKRPPPEDVVRRSLSLYDDFYAFLHHTLDDVVRRNGGFVMLDVHSYNHRRDGPHGPPGDAAENPDVNVGTGSLERTRWGALVDHFMDDLRRAGNLDVRENVRFRGRRLAAWVHDTYPRTGCCLALEFKKTFMDEHTGEPDHDRIEALVDALGATIPGLERELDAVVGSMSARSAR